jgi:hypothetical protein
MRVVASVPSEIVDYLDRHFGAASVLLTIVLIGVTAYYATQNRRMVKEMAKTRDLSVMPKLALEFHRLGPTAMDVAIRNVGPGTAIGVDVRLIFEPVGGGPVGERRWRHNILVPGEQRDFLPPGGLTDNVNTLPAAFQRIRLVGSMQDAVGTRHVVDEVLDDLPEWREVLRGAHQRWVAADPERRLAEEFAKKFERALSGLGQAVEGIRRAMSETERLSQRSGFEDH